MFLLHKTAALHDLIAILSDRRTAEGLARDWVGEGDPTDETNEGLKEVRLANSTLIVYRVFGSAETITQTRRATVQELALDDTDKAFVA